MSLRKKRPLEQESSLVQKNRPTLETDFVLKIPVVQLYNLKSELVHQSKKQHVQNPDPGPLSDQGRQENRPDDGSVPSKLSPPPLAHNERLSPIVHCTSNQQQNTTESRVCTSDPKRCLKVPVVRLFRFQPETQEEKTNASDSARHHTQNNELQKTDQQDDPHVNISYTSLEAICKKQQPVVKLYRLDTLPKLEEEKQSNKLDGEQYSDQVPDTSEANDSIALSSLAQKTPLSPNTNVRRKSNRHKRDPETVLLKQPIVVLNRLNIETEHRVRQVIDEHDKEHQRDEEQLLDDSSLNMEPETPEEQSMDDSDSDQSDEEELENVSEYERERLRNIKQNSKFLKCLELREDASSLFLRHKKKYAKRLKLQSDTIIRKSMRLQGIEPSPDVLRATRLFNKPERPDIPHGPIKMFPYNNVDEGAWRSFQDTWESISQGKFASPTSLKCRKLTSYANRLQQLTLEKKAITKVLPGFISALAVHPSNTRTLVAVGDTYGNVGLWDLKNRSAGVYQFPIHASKTSFIAFSPSDPRHLLSLGREGSIRCGDLTNSVFDEIYYETGCLSSFDFLSTNGSVLIVSHFDSKLSVVDRRTKTSTYDVRGCLDLQRVYSVNVHPLKRDLCVVAGEDNVLIYDVRMLSKELTQPLMGLLGHSGNTVTAAFSPCTGKRILTRSLSKCLRVFRVEHFDHDVYPVKEMRYYLRLGLPPVLWDPKQENCFVEGIMSPGRININHVKGQCIHTLTNTYHPARPAALAIHPTRDLLVVGTYSKFVCLWKKWKNTLDPPKEDQSLDDL